MNMLEHFRNECKILGWDKTDDEMQNLIVNNVEDVLKVVSNQGHSGSSMPYLLNLLNKAIKFEPLSPLTGDDDEWNDVGGGEMYQNKRNSSVFKDRSNKAYTIYAYAFRKPNKSCYTNGFSHKNIKFPYTVKDTIYIDVPLNVTDNFIKNAIKKIEEK